MAIIKDLISRKKGSLTAAFTLIELLLILAILGTLVAIVSPNISAGLQGTELASSSRSFVQACRYARTMALLHQAETEVLLISAPREGENAIIKVRAKQKTSMPDNAESVPDKIGVISKPPHQSDLSVANDTDFGDEIENTPADEDFATEISSTFQCRNIIFTFEGFLDNVENEGTSSPSTQDNNATKENPCITLEFKSNGLCRPFAVNVASISGDSYRVVVDVTGAGKIEGYGDEE